MAGSIQVGNVGTIFRLTIKDEDEAVVNCSTGAGCTAKVITFEMPDDTTSTKNASYYTDGSDGIIQYAATTGFIADDGDWKMQGRVTIGSAIYYSDVIRFNVEPSLATA